MRHHHDHTPPSSPQSPGCEDELCQTPAQKWGSDPERSEEMATVYLKDSGATGMLFPRNGGKARLLTVCFRLPQTGAEFCVIN